MKFKRQPPPSVPEFLERFVPEDWHEDRFEAATRWSAARIEWLRAHPEVNGVDFFSDGRAERRRVLYGEETNQITPSRRRNL